MPLDVLSMVDMDNNYKTKCLAIVLGTVTAYQPLRRYTRVYLLIILLAGGLGLGLGLAHTAAI